MDQDFEVVAAGDQSRFQDEEPEERWATNESEWQRLWEDTAGNESEPPTVDFSERFVIGVFLGERPSSGYAVEVRGVGYEERHTEYFEVEYVELQPEAGCGVLTVITHPYQFVAVSSESVRLSDLQVRLVAGEPERVPCE